MISDMTKHAKPTEPAPAPRSPGHVLAAAWLVLLANGGTSVAFNVWHSLAGLGMPVWAGIAAGLTPVLCVLGLSHMAAWCNYNMLVRVMTFAVMIGAMGLSMTAMAWALRAEPPVAQWAFGPVIDAAALMALHMILTDRERAAERIRAAEVAAEAARLAAAETAKRATGEATPSATGEAIDRATGRATGRATKEPATRATRGASHDPEAEAARAMYRRSVREGKPLSDRALGAEFGKSRTWGATRIREYNDGPKLAAASSG